MIAKVLRTRKAPGWLGSMFLFLGGWLLYLATLAPTVVTIFDDSLELQLAVPTLAIIHPTGYPLYELLAWLVQRFWPVGDAAYGVNLFSALAAALALAWFYLTARRLGAGVGGTVVAAWLLAIGPVWWSQATIAEVYTFQGFLTLFILWAFLRWEDETRAHGAASLALPGLALGMGLAHHRLTLLMIPGLVLFLAWVDPRFFLQPRRWVAPLVALVLPLSTYMLLPLRSHVGSLDGTYAQMGFWKWIAGGGYGTAFLRENPFGIHRTPLDLFHLARDQYGWLGLGVIALSLPWWRRRPRAAWLLAWVALADFLFATVYKVQDIQVFLIPLFVVMALWLAWGLDTLGQGVAALARGGIRFPWAGHGLLAVATLLILIWPVWLTWVRWPEQDRSQPPARAWGVRDLGLDMLESAAPRGRVIGLLGEMTLLRYLQFDPGIQPGVETVAADDESLRLEAIATSVAQGCATYTTHPLPGLAESFSLTAAGPLIRVWPAGRAQGPAPGHEVDVWLLPGLRLTGWDDILRVPASGPSLRVLLWWQATQPLPSYKISVRLLGPDDTLLAQQDAIPVHHAYPTSLWRPGETVLDAYDMPLPASPPPGSSLLLILYDPSDGHEYARWRTGLGE